MGEDKDQDSARQGPPGSSDNLDEEARRDAFARVPEQFCYTAEEVAELDKRFFEDLESTIGVARYTEILTSASVWHRSRGADLGALRRLVELAEDAEWDDNEDRTLLMYAVKYNQEEAVKFLLSAGADIDVSDMGDNTALDEAVFKGNPSMAQLLMARGADVSAYSAETVVHLRQKGLVEMAQFIEQTIRR